MRKITDKCVILLLCCAAVGASYGYVAVVMAFLAAISAASAVQYSENSRISLVAEIIYLALCFVFPAFVVFAPIVLYEIINEKRVCFYAVAAVAFAIHVSRGNLENTAAIMLIAVVSVILQSRTSALTALEKEYRSSRDNSVELTTKLTDYNRSLRENQDYEVYLATLKERNRIAREIHDNVGHLLSRSILQTGALQAVSKDEFVQEGLSGLSETLNNAMTTIRQSVHDLHDDSVDMAQAFADAAKPLKESGFVLETDFDCSDNLPNNIKFCLISIIKEGVANIIRHSSGSRARIILREHPAFYQLVIEDNGCCNGNTNSDGIGLLNMRERVETLGGILQITSDKNGFRIFISLKKEEN